MFAGNQGPSNDAGPSSSGNIAYGRACDQCNFRKVKCRPTDNPELCFACRASGLKCERSIQAKRRGPKATRILALKERETSEGSQPTVPVHDAHTNIDPSLNWPSNVFDAPPVSISPLTSSTSAPDGVHPPQTWYTQNDMRQNSMASTSTAPVNPGASGEFPDLASWITWPDTALNQSDARTLPFIDWARDSTFDFLAPPAEPILPPEPQPIVKPAARPVFDQASPLDLESLTAKSIQSVIDVYFEQCYPMFPVLNEARVRAAAAHYFSSVKSGNSSGPSATSSSEWIIESILALLESRERKPGSGPGKRLEALSSRAIIPAVLNAPTVDHVVVYLHLFVSHHLLGDRTPAWFYLQQGMTLLLMLGPGDWESIGRNEERLRLYLIMFIVDRASFTLQQYPPFIDQPMRLPDDAYNSSAAMRLTLPRNALSDFPLSHLRLFSLIMVSHAACWQGKCSGTRCSAWTLEMAITTMDCLAQELDLARAGLTSNRSRALVQEANLVITIAWFRDRFWNVFYRHNLAGQGRQFDLSFISFNLNDATEFCSRIRIMDFDGCLDCNAKLFDMARTALNVVRSLHPDNQSDLRSNLIASVYKILGLLSMIGPEQGTFLKDLKAALAELS